MIFQLVVGFCVAGINIVIHAMLTVTTIRVARASSGTVRPWRHLIGVMTATVLVLMAAFCLVARLWSYQRRAG